MTARVHALDVALVVTFLQGVRGGVAGSDAAHTTGEQADAGADCGTARAIYRGPHGRTDDRTHCRAGDPGIDGGCRRCRTTKRLVGVVPAGPVVGAKLAE